MKVLFAEDTEIRDHLGRVEQSFRAGEVVELSTASARRWIRRNRATEFVGAPKIVLKAPPAPPTKGGHGASPDSGKGKLPSASPPAPASVTMTSSTSAAPETKEDAESSSSIEPSSEPSGPTSSTGPTPHGGGRRRTPPGSGG